jgi:hypothetical protein
MKSCPGELHAFWSNMSETVSSSASGSSSRTDVLSSAVPGPIVAASLSAAAAARLIIDGRLHLSHHERSTICAALAIQLAPASHLLADVPFSCPLTAPAAAELIIRVLAADSPQIHVPVTERAVLLAAVAEYALHLTQTSASSSSPAPCRRTADNSSRR